MEPPPEPEPEPSEFAIADATGSENPGAAIFTVTRTGDLSGTVSVDYETNAITATEGVDYTGAAGTLTFEPGVSELTIEVDVTADNLYEPVERFEITSATQRAMPPSPMARPTAAFLTTPMRPPVSCIRAAS